MPVPQLPILGSCYCKGSVEWVWSVVPIWREIMTRLERLNGHNKKWHCQWKPHEKLLARLEVQRGKGQMPSLAAACSFPDVQAQIRFISGPNHRHKRVCDISSTVVGRWRAQHADILTLRSHILRSPPVQPR